MRYLCLLFLSACSTIDVSDPPPVDWPAMRIMRYYGKIPEACGSSLLNYNIACAVPDFCAKTCNVYLRVDWAWVKEHEELHCKGYDHPKPDRQIMRTSWGEWKTGIGRDLCKVQMGMTNYCKKWPEDC